MYSHIVTLKVHVSTTFTTFIYFCDISKRKKMKENDFFFFVKNLGMPGVRIQKYPKSTSTQKVSGTDMTPFLEHPCFIGVFSFLLQLSEAIPGVREVREQRKQIERQKPFQNSRFTSKNKNHNQESITLKHGCIASFLLSSLHNMWFLCVTQFFSSITFGCFCFFFFLNKF